MIKDLPTLLGLWILTIMFALALEVNNHNVFDMSKNAFQLVTMDKEHE